MTLKNFLKKGFDKVVSCLETTKSFLDTAIDRIESFNHTASRSCALDERNNSTGKFKYVYELHETNETDALRTLDFFKGKCEGLFWNRNKSASIHLVEIGGYGGKSGIEFSFDSERDLNHFRKNTFGIASVEPFKSLMNNQSFQP